MLILTNNRLRSVHIRVALLQVMVRRVKGSNGAQLIRELTYVMPKRSITVGDLRARVSRELGHPANQAREPNNIWNFYVKS